VDIFISWPQKATLQIDVHRSGVDSLDIEIYYSVITTGELRGCIQEVAEAGRGEEGLGAGPVGDVEGGVRVRRGRRRLKVMGAEDVLNKAQVDVIACFDTVFGIDKKALAADETANARREPGWVALVHGRPAFVMLDSVGQRPISTSPDELS
jgi:hypothetical protein